MSLECVQSFIKIGGVVFEKMRQRKHTDYRIYYQDIYTSILLSLQYFQQILTQLFFYIMVKKNISTYPLSWKNYCPIFFANFFGPFFFVFGHFQHSSHFLICLSILVPNSILKLYQTTVIFCVLLNLAIICLNTGEHT